MTERNNGPSISRQADEDYGDSQYIIPGVDDEFSELRPTPLERLRMIEARKQRRWRKGNDEHN